MKTIAVLLLASSFSLACDAGDGTPGDAGTTTETTTALAGQTDTTSGDAGPGGGGATTVTAGEGTAHSADDGITESTRGTTTGSTDDGTTGVAGGSGDATTGTSNETTGGADYDAVYASVTSVAASGDEGAYAFSVGVLSPDTGCEQYANWWEIVTEDGELVYRRILTHSHVPPDWKQPFVRTGAPVAILGDQLVIVRAHMNTSSFGYRTFRGSVDAGFESFETEPDFAADLEAVPPQPGECPF